MMVACMLIDQRGAVRLAHFDGTWPHRRGRTHEPTRTEYDERVEQQRDGHLPPLSFRTIHDRGEPDAVGGIDVAVISHDGIDAPEDAVIS